MNEAQKFMDNWLENKKENKMKKEELLAQVDYWGNECRICAEHHNYSCETGCPHQQRCEPAYKEIVALLKKEVTEEWIDEKAMELTYIEDIEDYKDFIYLLVEEIHGRSKD